MAGDSRIVLKYRFEDADAIKPSLTSPIERFGHFAMGLLGRDPALACRSVFGRAETIAGGLLDPGSIPHGGSESGPRRRLRCIEDQSGPVLEYRYDNAGRLAEAVILGSVHEKYFRAADGTLLSVASSGSQLTQFRRDNLGRLSSMVYADGSAFTYRWEAGHVLSSIQYPDGQSISYRRDARSRPDRITTNPGVFEFSWNPDGHLEKMQFANGHATWSLGANLSSRKLTIPFHQANGPNHTDVSSAIGLWRYDPNGFMREIVAINGERYVRSVRGPAEIEAWNVGGQSIYSFDQGGNLMNVLNSNGTRVMFKRLPDRRGVLAISAAGVSILFYDSFGRLVAVRDELGRGSAFDYADSGDLASLSSASGDVRFRWSGKGALEEIDLTGKVRCRFSFRDGLPHDATLDGAGPLNLAAAAIPGWVWNWDATKARHRLTDSVFRG